MRTIGTAALLVAALFTVTDHAVADEPVGPKAHHVQPYKPCEYEDSRNCVWDALHMGNGRGQSFVISKRGKVTYVPHRVAHLLAHR